MKASVKDVVMARGGVLLFTHPWLGPLRLHEVDVLICHIDVDPTVRAPRLNGDRDIEILLRMDLVELGPTAAQGHIDRCASLCQGVLADLDRVKMWAVEHAPAKWLHHYGADGGPPLIDRLFLEGLDVNVDLQVAILFDFGELDLLEVNLDAHRECLSVAVVP